MLQLALPLLIAFMPLVVDKQSHSVTFTACATGVREGTILEFAFVGPDSDRAYEAMFVTDARVPELVRAFEQAGIPCGKPVSNGACRFWPVGKLLTVEPPIWNFISNKDDQASLPICYTGGSRDCGNFPIADTNMPSAVLSLYSIDQSLMLLDDALDQSQAYGCYLSRRDVAQGERHTFKFTWDGVSGTKSQRLELAPGKIRTELESLRKSTTDLDVEPYFSPELTVVEAKAAATALSVIDSRAVRINGRAPGQFFYKGFLPDEQWRTRSKRLTQPLEVHISSTNVICTVIDEDWSVEGDDPKLTPHDEPIGSTAKVFKGDTCIFYASAGEKLGRIFTLMKQLPSTIRNWYVYID